MRAAIGLERGKVRLVAYDPGWPALFEAEAASIRGALGASVVALEHMGSTAVAGLIAKPVIDVLLAVWSLRAPRHVYTALERIGYDHRPLDPLGDRLFFAKDSELGRTHNLSVCTADSAFWIAHVKFRDRLRADARWRATTHR